LHQVQSGEAHFLEVLGALVAFLHAGNALDLVADFGLTPLRQTRRAALRFAVKYSVSMRSYIIRAASIAIAWRSLRSLMPFNAPLL